MKGLDLGLPVTYQGRNILLQEQAKEHLVRRRNEIEIVRDILNVAEAGARKTRILYLANLNTSTLERYLSFLRRIWLLDFDAANNIYWTTMRGKEYIQKFDECKKYKGMHEIILMELQSLLIGLEAM
jgi:predicted transcriptional regulator